jgi:hypothetical protein
MSSPSAQEATGSPFAYAGRALVRGFNGLMRSMDLAQIQTPSRLPSSSEEPEKESGHTSQESAASRALIRYDAKGDKQFLLPALAQTHDGRDPEVPNKSYAYAQGQMAASSKQ